MAPHNIYIHVPYCMSKCNYCAFHSRACGAPDWDAYAAGVINEIGFWGGRMGKIDVPTIFFGGGTPSLMPTGVFARIMDALGQNFHIVAGAEITLESNPGTIDDNKLSEFLAAGVNRISIGVQRTDDAALRFLGRRHDWATARNIIDVSARRGVRVSADFIYGIPGDNAQSVAQMCRDINALPIEHCSMYELTIEPNTPFGKMNLNMPSNDAMADMYDAIDRTLRHHRYEVSNYAATPAAQCRHNANVWDGAPYIGIGVAAAGRVFIDNTWYEQTGGADGVCTPMTMRDRAVEMVLTGMRTMRGVAVNDMTRCAIDMDFVRTHPDLITMHDGRICATPRGILILDDLMVELVK